MFLDCLQAMVSEDPLYVIRRYESRRYATDEAVRREYLKVLYSAFQGPICLQF